VPEVGVADTENPTTPELHPAAPMGDSGRSGGTPPDGGDDFSAQDLAYIAARARGATIKAAARAARPPFPYTTARRLDDREDVRAAVRKLARESIDDGVRGLAASASAAARALKQVATKGGAGDGPRVSAARAILEISHKALEVEDLESRIVELEAAQGKQPGFRRS
jgi:hypothetical protein